MAKRKVINTIVIVAVISLMVAIFVPGALKISKFKKEIQKQEQIKKKLIKKNKVLRQEEKLLEENPEYLEEVAREELGLIKKEEVIYRRELEENKSNKD